MTNRRRTIIATSRVSLFALALLAGAIAGCSALDPDTAVGTANGPGLDPGGIAPGRPDLVVPRPGQLDVHPIAAQAMAATIDGRHVAIAIDYTSGVEPCSVLDRVDVEPTADGYRLTLQEGHGAADVACIEIAVFKRTVVDLGELAAGTYIIEDGAGGAPPITIVVS